MNERISLADNKSEVRRQNLVPQIRRKTDSSQSMGSPVDRILFLQGTIGNQAVGKLIKSGALQAKLRIGQPGDIYEQEADRVAEQVMRMPDVSGAKETRIQRKCPNCLHGLLRMDKKDERIQAKEIRGETPEVTSNMETNINALWGGGQPLPEDVSAFFEPRFGTDFSQVRVHSGAAAEQSAKELNANAYTVGHNIVFGGGSFAPGTHEGRQLIAHELTHVVQQSGHQGTLTPIFAHIQRTRRRLGTCTPAQDDLRPTAPWETLQTGYQARCGRARNRLGALASRAWEDLRSGRRPRLQGGAPAPRDSVDCACAYGDPRMAAYAALVRVRAAGPLAARMFLHFLDNTGTEMNIDVADMIGRSPGVRAKIISSIRRSRGNVGTTRIEQREYGDEDLQFAYGAIDCVQWKVTAPRRGWRNHPDTPIEVSMLDYYEFHPARRAASQCAHAACVELVDRGQARNFWTMGTATVTLGNLYP